MGEDDSRATGINGRSITANALLNAPNAANIKPWRCDHFNSKHGYGIYYPQARGQQILQRLPVKAFIVLLKLLLQISLDSMLQLP